VNGVLAVFCLLKSAFLFHYMLLYCVPHKYDSSISYQPPEGTRYSVEECEIRALK